MSFEPENINNNATVNELLAEQNALLKAIVILLSEQNDDDPKQAIEAAEKLT